jgi:hypothetical protein
VAVLLLIGAAWGITQPFAKIAVSEGYRHFGFIFWQFALGALLLAAINRVRGRACRWSGATAVALCHHRAYRDAFAELRQLHRRHPSALGHPVDHPVAVPMLSFPIALALGMDRFSALRLLGLCLAWRHPPDRPAGDRACPIAPWSGGCPWR